MTSGRPRPIIPGSRPAVTRSTTRSRTRLLHLRLVLKRARPGGEHRRPVMDRQVVVCPVDVGFVAARPPHRRLLVVGNHELRHPTPELEHPHVQRRPVRQRPGQRHIDERVVRRRQHPDEHLRLMDLAGPPVRYLDRRARVVHERLLARPVDLAQHQRRLQIPVVQLVRQRPGESCLLARRT